MRAKDPLETYPNIKMLNESIGCGRGAMDELARYQIASLDILERTIPNLIFNKRPSLLALAADLFSDNNKTINAAICEILTFGWLKEKGLMDESAVGYPLDWKGDDPPFEGSLRCGYDDLPFDVKDGSGSGVQLLNNTLLKILKETAGAAAKPVPQLSVSVDAPSGQRWFDDNFKSIAKPFREELEKNGFADRVLSFEVGIGKVTVGINRSAGGSIMGMAEKASFMATQILRHAREKDKKLNGLAASRFLLIYLRRPHTGGADFDEYTTPKTFDFLASMPEIPTSLAAVLFVNYDCRQGHSSPEVLLWGKDKDVITYLGGEVNCVHETAKVLMPKKHQDQARALNPADITTMSGVVLGSCDLRGPACKARGSSDGVLVYFSAGQQYTVCSECVKTYKWPLSN